MLNIVITWFFFSLSKRFKHSPKTLEDEMPSGLNSATEECRPVKKKKKWSGPISYSGAIKSRLDWPISGVVHHHWAYILTERKWSDIHSMTWFLSWEEILLPCLTTCGKKRPCYRKCSSCCGRLVPWTNDRNRNTQSPVSRPVRRGMACWHRDRNA